jgi:SAM-dependent methyltransferase
MEKMRKPFQGVLNVIRFNWHYYIIAAIAILVLLIIAGNARQLSRLIPYTICEFIIASMVISLAASFFAYDLSGFYKLNWLARNNNERMIVNVHAGFDDTSVLLQDKFRYAELIVLDFYDPLKHTEVSIKRARKAYPPFPGTSRANTGHLPVADNSADKVFVILSAHEIRNEKERTAFFKELNRIIKPGGEIYVTEHLRDLVNFLSYNIGFFHFYPKISWLKTCQESGLILKRYFRNSIFISTFILTKNGNTD